MSRDDTHFYTAPFRGHRHYVSHFSVSNHNVSTPSVVQIQKNEKYSLFYSWSFWITTCSNVLTDYNFNPTLGQRIKDLDTLKDEHNSEGIKRSPYQDLLTKVCSN